jgi:hypothetical protein
MKLAILCGFENYGPPLMRGIFLIVGDKLWKLFFVSSKKMENGGYG